MVRWRLYSLERTVRGSAGRREREIQYVLATPSVFRWAAAQLS